MCRPLPTTCGTDADCPERFYCDDPYAPPRVCAAAASCQPVPPLTQCGDDSACAPGFHAVRTRRGLRAAGLVHAEQAGLVHRFERAQGAVCWTSLFAAHPSAAR
ncbi:MAG: hypothetical protein AMXMBFR34_12730 [Myxococcaceae bacterium]